MLSWLDERARQLARLVHFDPQDQVRFATSTSEIARNALQYARSGRVDFSVQFDNSQATFIVAVTDSGPGIPDLEAVLEGRYQSPTGMGVGIVGTRRLMDFFRLESVPGRGRE